MEQETRGTVMFVAKQWWFKVNTKAVRTRALDGAVFPHVIKVWYAADGKEYTKRKWIGAGSPVPAVGSFVRVRYCKEKPSKAKIF